jgi:hypothetical protein
MQINYELVSCIFAAIGFLLCVWCVILHNKIKDLKFCIENQNEYVVSKQKEMDKKDYEIALYKKKFTAANANKASLTKQVKSLQKKLADKK